MDRILLQKHFFQHIACQPDPAGGDHQSRPVCPIPFHTAKPRYFPDPLPRILRKPQRLLHHLPAVCGKLIPGTVERYHQQITRTRALHQLQILSDPVQRRLPHTVVSDVQYRALCQRPCDLVHALHTDIRTGLERAHRKPVMKVHMSPMCLVDQQKRIVRVADLRDRLQIRTDAIIARTHQEQCPAVRMLLKSLPDRIRRDRPLHRPVSDHLRHHIHRLRAGQDQTHQSRLVRVPGDHDLSALKCRAEDHRLIPTGTPVHQEKTPIRTVKRAEQSLRLADRPLRAVQVIRERRLRHIIRKDPCPDPVRPARTDTLIQSVPGHLKIRGIRLDQIGHCLQQRCLFLIHSVSFLQCQTLHTSLPEKIPVNICCGLCYSGYIPENIQRR